MNRKQMERELEALKKGLKEFQQKETTASLPTLNVADIGAAIKYLADERERTNKKLELITEKMRALDDAIKVMGAPAAQTAEEYALASGREIGLSNVDVKIISFIQTRNDTMACADEVKQYMNYKGNNAACARLNRLHKLGLLDRHQLGHKVYYRFDAGKTTNTLIVSPP